MERAADPLSLCPKAGAWGYADKLEQASGGNSLDQPGGARHAAQRVVYWEAHQSAHSPSGAGQPKRVGA